MPHFPVFIKLQKKQILVVGGGMDAYRKVLRLIPYKPDMMILAKKPCPELAELAAEHLNITIREKDFTETELEPYPEFVIAADSLETNQRVSRICKEKHILVNVVDQPELCSFIFPALVQKGKFSVGISSGGASPAAAIFYKERIRDLIPDRLDEILSWLESERPRLKDAIQDQRKKAGAFREIFEACIKKGAPLSTEEVERYLSEKAPGGVALICDGGDEADLITVRGMRLLQQCQAVVYDDGIAPELLSAAPEAADRICTATKTKEAVWETLIELSKTNSDVVRLYHSGSEWAENRERDVRALQSAGILCQCVPDI